MYLVLNKLWPLYCCYHFWCFCIIAEQHYNWNLHDTHEAWLFFNLFKFNYYPSEHTTLHKCWNNIAKQPYWKLPSRLFNHQEVKLLWAVYLEDGHRPWLPIGAWPGAPYKGRETMMAAIWSSVFIEERSYLTIIWGRTDAAATYVCSTSTPRKMGPAKQAEVPTVLTFTFYNGDCPHWEDKLI